MPDRNRPTFNRAFLALSMLGIITGPLGRLFTTIPDLIRTYRDAQAAKRRIVTLWQMADAKGVTPEQIKLMADKRYGYGSIDWKLSRPEIHQFMPTLPAIEEVIDHLAELPAKSTTLAQ